MNGVYKLLFLPEQQYATQKVEFYGKIPGHFATLETILGSKKFFLGKSDPTFNDFQILFVIETFKKMNPQAFDHCSTLKNWFDRMMSLKGIKKYKELEKAPFYPAKDFIPVNWGGPDNDGPLV